MQYMKLNEYMEAGPHGRAAALAAALGVSNVTVHLWVHGRRSVPPMRAVAIERETGGAVTRRDLRPNDWAQIWPELAATEGAIA